MSTALADRFLNAGPTGKSSILSPGLWKSFKLAGKGRERGREVGRKEGRRWVGRSGDGLEGRSVLCDTHLATESVCLPALSPTRDINTDCG